MAGKRKKQGRIMVENIQKRMISSGKSWPKQYILVKQGVRYEILVKSTNLYQNAHTRIRILCNFAPDIKK